MHAPEIDKPVTGLITDLKRRGLLDETVVVGNRNSDACRSRSAHSAGITTQAARRMWMCGAGIKGGQHIGASDEVGYKAAEQVIWNHDIHASLLHLLGIDHKRLTYYLNGRNMRLTDVAGELVPQIVGDGKRPAATPA